MAGLIGISPNTLSRYENGQMKVPYEIILRIVEITGIPIDELLPEKLKNPKDYNGVDEGLIKHMCHYIQGELIDKYVKKHEKRP